MWFPSQEEYYEYNYYRTHGAAPQIEVIDETTLKLTVDLPSGQYFYYPSVTVNLILFLSKQITPLADCHMLTLKIN